MSPEERAARTVLLLGNQLSDAILAAAIASAIRDAEDAALEGAAQAITEAARPKAFGTISVGDELNMQAAAWFCELVRSLKHTKD